MRQTGTALGIAAIAATCLALGAVPMARASIMPGPFSTATAGPVGADDLSKLSAGETSDAWRGERIARRGADDGPNHDKFDDKGRRGKKDGKGRGRGADDGPNHDRFDDKGRRGKKKDGKGRGRGSDDGPNHT